MRSMCTFTYVNRSYSLQYLEASRAVDLLQVQVLRFIRREICEMLTLEWSPATKIKYPVCCVWLPVRYWAGHKKGLYIILHRTFLTRMNHFDIIGWNEENKPHAFNQVASFSLSFSLSLRTAIVSFVLAWPQITHQLPFRHIRRVFWRNPSWTYLFEDLTCVCVL